MFWFSQQFLFETIHIFRRTEQDIKIFVINIKTPSCKVSVVIVRF